MKLGISWLPAFLSDRLPHSQAIIGLSARLPTEGRLPRSGRDSRHAMHDSGLLPPVGCRASRFALTRLPRPRLALLSGDVFFMDKVIAPLPARHDDYVRSFSFI
jgi:hypothetical protein